jgi:hypothetical protein
LVLRFGVVVFCFVFLGATRGLRRTALHATALDAAIALGLLGLATVHAAHRGVPALRLVVLLRTDREGEVLLAVLAVDEHGLRSGRLLGRAALGATHGGREVVAREEGLVCAREDKVALTVAALQGLVLKAGLLGLDLHLGLLVTSVVLGLLGVFRCCSGVLVHLQLGLLGGKLLGQVRHVLGEAAELVLQLRRAAACGDGRLEGVQIHLGLCEELLGDERHFVLGCCLEGGEVPIILALQLFKFTAAALNGIHVNILLLFLFLFLAIVKHNPQIALASCGAFNQTGVQTPCLLQLLDLLDVQLPQDLVGLVV